MGIVSVVLGINLYVLLVGLFHKMFSDRHGDGKAFIFGNLVLLAGVLLMVLVFY